MTQPKRHILPAMETQTITTRETADDTLAPIRAWVHANHGSIKRVAAKMAEATGQPITRQTVGRWLHRDPSKRQEPSYGAGILLERAVRELQQEAPVQ